MEESKLIDQLKNNHDAAFVELINLYGNKLLRTIYLMIGDEKEAEDIVQETFIRVFKSIKRFKGKSSLYTWIYRISQNIAKDRLKGQVTIPYEDIELSLENVEESVMTKADREILRRELNNLPFIYKEVLILFYFEDLSIKEVSEALNEKEGTIKSKLSRGRQILKKSLEGGKLNG